MGDKRDNIQATLMEMEGAIEKKMDTLRLEGAAREERMIEERTATRAENVAREERAEKRLEYLKQLLTHIATTTPNDSNNRENGANTYVSPPGSPIEKESTPEGNTGSSRTWENDTRGREEGYAGQFPSLKGAERPRRSVETPIWPRQEKEVRWSDIPEARGWTRDAADHAGLIPMVSHYFEISKDGETSFLKKMMIETLLGGAYECCAPTIATAGSKIK